MPNETDGCSGEMSDPDGPSDGETNEPGGGDTSEPDGPSGGETNKPNVGHASEPGNGNTSNDEMNELGGRGTASKVAGSPPAPMEQYTSITSIHLLHIIFENLTTA